MSIETTPLGLGPKPTQTAIPAAPTPDPTDTHVGTKIRELRRRLGHSQEWLAAKVNLTFQQIQKYERAANRVSASKLFEIANALEVHPGYFFPEGRPEAYADGDPFRSAALITYAHPTLIDRLSALPGPAQRSINVTVDALWGMCGYPVANDQAAE